MKKIRNFVTGILQNVLAQVVLTAGTVLFGVLYAFYTESPQLALQVVLITLLVVDISLGIYSFKRQSVVQSKLDRTSSQLSRMQESLLSERYEVDPISREIERELEIADNYFEEQSDPQRIVVRFVNRGANIIHIDKIKYSADKLPSSALASSYRRDSEGYHLISFNQDEAEVVPRQEFQVEIKLSQKWRRADIDRIAGQWGYLRIVVTYADDEAELFYSI